MPNDIHDLVDPAQPEGRDALPECGRGSMVIAQTLWALAGGGEVPPMPYRRNPWRGVQADARLRETHALAWLADHRHPVQRIVAVCIARAWRIKPRGEERASIDLEDRWRAWLLHTLCTPGVYVAVRDTPDAAVSRLIGQWMQHEAVVFGEPRWGG